MNSKTKIIVLHMKEIIYTVIFATLGILILCLLFFMFSGDVSTQDTVGKSLYDGRFTGTRFTDKNRVVLGTPPSSIRASQ